MSGDVSVRSPGRTDLGFIELSQRSRLDGGRLPVKVDYREVLNSSTRAAVAASIAVTTGGAGRVGTST